MAEVAADLARAALGLRRDRRSGQCRHRLSVDRPRLQRRRRRSRGLARLEQRRRRPRRRLLARLDFRRRADRASGDLSDDDDAGAVDHRPSLAKGTVFAPPSPPSSLTNSRGGLAAFVVVGLVLLCSSRGSLALLKPAIFTAVLPVVLLPIFLPGLNLHGLCTSQSLQSFLERIEQGWPGSWDLVFHDGDGLLGRGIGGIGSPQRLFAPQYYFPADNLTIFLFAYFGVFAALYLAWPLTGWRDCRAGSTPPLAFACALLLYFLLFGVVMNIIEDQFAATFLGAMLALLARKPRRTSRPGPTTSPAAKCRTMPVSSLSGLRQRASLLAREIGVLRYVEYARFVNSVIRHHGSNRDFRRQARDVKTPPLWVAYDAFNNRQPAQSLCRRARAGGHHRRADRSPHAGRRGRAIPARARMGLRPRPRHPAHAEPAGAAGPRRLRHRLQSDQHRLVPAQLPGDRFRLQWAGAAFAACVDASIDVIYAISVFTHLSEAMHESWMAELRRVLKPDGILLATLHGNKVRGKLTARAGALRSRRAGDPRQRRRGLAALRRLSPRRLRPQRLFERHDGRRDARAVRDADEPDAVDRPQAGGGGGDARGDVARSPKAAGARLRR